METFIDAINELASENHNTRRRAIRTVETCLSSCSPESLIALESRLRSSTCSCYQWDQIDKDWALNQQWPTAIWCLLSMHRSGYIREPAVRTLCSGRLNGQSLPFLLLRLNDWVPQVRDAAFEGAHAFLNEKHLHEWTRSLGLIQILRTRTRVDHYKLFGDLLLWYLRPETEPVLRAAIDSTDRAIARTAIAMALKLEHDRRGPLITSGLKSSDPEIRRMSAVAARNWPASPHREDWLAIMHADRFMPVRREALLARIEELGEVRRNWFQQSLLDSHRSMRQLGQYYLSRDETGSPGLNAREFYLDVLRQPSTPILRSAILGLAETGIAADADFLKQLVSHIRTPIAAAAVEGVATLAAKENLEFFVSLMTDPRPAVVRQAAAPLIKAYDGYSVDRLRGVVQRGPSTTSRLWALRVLTSRHPYDAFVDIVLAANHDDAAVRELALVRARAISKSFRIPRGPFPAEVDAIRRALQSQTAAIPPELQSILHHYIGLSVGA